MVRGDISFSNAVSKDLHANSTDVVMLGLFSRNFDARNFIDLSTYSHICTCIEGHVEALSGKFLEFRNSEISGET